MTSLTAKDTRTLPLGTWVFCTVRAGKAPHGYLGWYRVLAVRPRDGYLKLDHGGNYWSPPFNFTLTSPVTGKTFGEI